MRRMKAFDQVHNRIRSVYHSSRLAFIVFFLISVLMLASTVIFSRVSSKTILEGAFEKNNVLLHRIVENLENEFSHIEKTVLEFVRSHISLDPVDLHIEDDYERYRLHKSISKFIEFNPYTDSIHIYYHNGERVYYQTSRTSGTMQTDDFHDNAFYRQTREGLVQAGFSSERLLVPDYFEKESSENKAVPVVSCVKRLPLNSLNSENMIIVNLRTEYINEIAKRNINAVANTILVFNKEGGTILSFSESNDLPEDAGIPIQIADEAWKRELQPSPAPYALVVNQKKHYVLSVVPADSQRLYAILLPEDKLLEPITQMNRIMFISSFVVLLAGVLVSLLINRSFFRPVLGILQKLNGSGEKCGDQPGQNVYSQIRNQIDDMIQDKAKMEEKLQQYFSAFRERERGSLKEEDIQSMENMEPSGMNHKDLIQKVIEYIHDHYMDNIGLDTIARQVYFSPAYLGKVFREVSGITFSEYLINTRMKAAAELLLSNTGSISLTAAKTGYSTLQSFSKAFKKHYHCSPGEYRKKLTVQRL